MAGFTYYIYWSTTNDVGVDGQLLANVQSFHSFRGRQGSLDPISAGSLTVTVMNPQQSPLVGQFIMISTVPVASIGPATDVVYFAQITDVQYQYYNQSIPAGDVLTLTCIDPMGLLLSGNVTGTAASATSGTFLGNTLTAAGWSTWTYTDAGLSTCSAQTYAATSMAEAFNAIQNTERGHMWWRPYYTGGDGYFRARGNYTAQTVTFDPSTNSSTKQIYQELVFQSATTEVFGRFTISPQGLTAQTYPTAAGAKTNTLDTYDVSTAQALNNATAAAAMYGSTGNRIKSVTCFDKAQTTQKLNVFDVNDQVTVNWRSTNYTGIVEGIEVSASPNGAYYTFYLSAEETMDYLILNNAVFGKLDNNKLGF